MIAIATSLSWKDSDHTDIFLNQLNQFYSNNATNLQHLGLTSNSYAVLPNNTEIGISPQLEYDHYCDFTYFTLCTDNFERKKHKACSFRNKNVKNTQHVSFALNDGRSRQHLRLSCSYDYSKSPRRRPLEKKLEIGIFDCHTISALVTSGH